MSKANEIGQRIEEWFKAKEFTGVVFLRNQNPPNDMDDDYAVAEDILFTSPDLTRGSIEIAVTPDGSIGVGIEKRERIASRLGLTSKSPMYAGGFEPHAVPEAAIHKIIELTASGSISVSYICLPLLGLVFTKLALPENEIRNLKLLGLIVADRVFTSISGGCGLRKTCHLEPWN